MSAFASPTDIRQFHNHWGTFLALGVLLILVGSIALVYTPAVTLGTVVILGWLIFASGIIECVHAFQTRRWSGVLLQLLSGVLGLLIGLLLITHPVAGAFAWTMMFAAFLTVLGLFRAVAAVLLRFQSWGWMLLDGCATLILGVLLWAEWPSSALWFLGFALGIALVLRGWTTVMFAFAVRATEHIVPIQHAA